MENVKYLHFKSGADEQNENPNIQGSCDDLWKLLLEKTTVNNLDPTTGPLWSLTFFRIEQNFNNNNKNEYACILKIAHSVMDGLSCNTALMQLFSIIEKKVASGDGVDSRVEEEEKSDSNVSILPSKEEFFNYVPAVLPPGLPTDPFTPVPKFLVDRHQDAEAAEIENPPTHVNLTEHEINHGLILTHPKNEVFLSVKDLVSFSSKYDMKSQLLVIGREHLSQVMATCKKNQVKFTSFLDMVTALGLRMIHEKYQKEQEEKQPTVIKTSFMVGMGNFEAGKKAKQQHASDNQLACWAGSAASELSEPLPILAESNLWSDQFWSLAKKKNDALHESLTDVSFDRMPFLGLITDMYSKQLMATPPNQQQAAMNELRKRFSGHYNISNLGIIKSSPSLSSSIRVSQAFTNMKFNREVPAFLFNYTVATVDEQLFLTLFYNSWNVHYTFMNELRENMAKIVGNLIGKSTFSFTDSSTVSAPEETLLTRL